MRMSPSDVVAFLEGGVRQDQLLGGHVDLPSLLGFSTGPITGLVVFGAPIALAGVAALEIVRSNGVHRGIIAAGMICLAAVGIAAWGLPGLVNRGLGQQIAPLGLLVLLFGLWAVGRGAISNRRVDRGAPASPDRRTLGVLALFLACLPYAEAVGSNSPFTGAMSQAALFWMLATLVGLRMAAAPRENAKVKPGEDQFQWNAVVVLLVALAVTSVSMATVLTNGGSGASLIAASEPVRVAGGTLWLPAAEAAVARELNSVAQSAGLRRSTPVVDLTGISPGYAFQLGGRPLGRESFMGVFPGAPDAAAYALAQHTCQDRAEMWVLWAADNPSDVSTKVDLGGRLLPGSYEEVGRFAPVQGPDPWRLLTVRVLRPTSGNSCR